MSSASVNKDVSPEKVSNKDPQGVEKASNESPQEFEEDPQVFDHDFDDDDNEDYTDITHKEVLIFKKIVLRCLL